jgi:hypothetical protein
MAVASLDAALVDLLLSVFASLYLLILPSSSIDVGSRRLAVIIQGALSPAPARTVRRPRVDWSLIWFC